MGCSGSKQEENALLPSAVPSEVVELNMNEVKAKLNDLYLVKESYHALLLEQYGLNSLLEKCREQLTELANTQLKSKENYEFLLNYVIERDCDDLYRALQSSSSVDKRILIDILTARPKWQLDRIGAVYEKKYQIQLINEIQKHLKKFSGAQSDLGKLLLNICMEQPQRDSHLLYTHMKEFDVIVEVSHLLTSLCLSLCLSLNIPQIISTRTNRELRDILAYYRTAYGKELPEVIKSKTYKNFGKMACRILECKRSESTEPAPPEVVTSLVEELHHAATKKDADIYIRIFSDLSFSEFRSLSKGYAIQYGDIMTELSKFSGDFYSLLLARCSEKYDYLCYRLHAEGASAVPRSVVDLSSLPHSTPLLSLLPPSPSLSLHSS
jgi:hypothetical protein